MTTRERDEPTGTQTTGHEWDGIKELDTPLPKWWIYVFYATIVWSIGYWIVMPAWPLVWGDGSYTEGVIGYSQRDVVARQLAEAEAARADYRERIAARPLDEIRRDDELMPVALAGGRAAFGDNCAGCHGSGAQGFTGFPNLNDDEWLWGGTLEDIHTTILHGIRWEADLDTRYSEMPKFLTDGLLTREQVADTTQYVLSLSGRATDAAAVTRGAVVYEEQCVICHMEGGVGDRFQGAPNLADAIWLYGGDEQAIYQSIANSRFGVMPSWADRLDPVTIKELALYVHALGGGETAPTAALNMGEETNAAAGGR